MQRRSVFTGKSIQCGYVIIVALLETPLVLCFLILSLYDFQHPPISIDSNKYLLYINKKKKKKGRKPKKNQNQGSSGVAFIRKGMLYCLDLYLWQQRSSVCFLRLHL